MHVLNEHRCDFWVKRRTWSENIARTTNIDGKFDGPLEGGSPYFKNQKVRGTYMKNEPDEWCA